jgi:threonine dehydrogenase-like Zn-dependent dehydrogenase
MKALWFDGKKLSLRQLRKPSPARDEALIRVNLAGICNTDVEIFRGYMGFTGVPGHEFVGTVEAGHKKMLGRRVVGEINLACGKCLYCENSLPRHCPYRSVLGIQSKNGAFAEYLTLPVANLHIIPDSISDLEAVFIEPLAAALRILDQVEIKKASSVYILGDGKLAQLIARVVKLRTDRMVVVGKHIPKLRLLDKLGIKTVLFKDLKKMPAEAKPDFVIEATGAPEGIATALEICRPLGTVVVKSTYHGNPQVNLSKLVVDEIKFVGSRCGDFKTAITFYKQHKVPLEDLASGIFRLTDYKKAFSSANSSNSLKVILKCQE